MKKHAELRPISMSIESEQAVLGGLMLDASAWLSVADILEPQHFFRNDHQLIYSAIVALSNERKTTDPVTVSDALARRKELVDAGGLAYLGTLTRDTPGASNVRQYAEIIRDRWRHRESGIIGNGLAAAAAQGDDLIDESIQKLMALAHSKSVLDGTIGESITEFIDELDEMYRTKSRPPGVMTGISRLDSKLGGFSPGHLIVIAGRPSMGKTTLALNICSHDPQLPKGMNSTEQPRKELIRSMVAMRSGVSGHAMRLGQIVEDDWPKIVEASKIIREMPFFVNDASEPDQKDIFRQARKWKHFHNIKLLVSDYLQRIKGPERDRHQQVEMIARGHKNIARELGIPVILLSQISRDVEKREDKRPQMSDLRDSGAIEQEADLILTVYRDEVYYGKQSRPGEAEIAVLKNRHGPTGVVTCKFVGSKLRFEDADDDFDAGAQYGSNVDIPFDSPPGGDGAPKRPVENRRGPYRRSTTGG